MTKRAPSFRPSPKLSRREFLSRSSLGVGLFGAASYAPYVRSVQPTPRFADNPFQLGVASGYPLEDGVVLWTRLFTNRENPVPQQPIPVSWEIAEDEAMARVVRNGTAIAHPNEGHSLHIEVDGLLPERWYWYRFHVGNEESRIARTRTTPAPDSIPERLRFAFASCQHYEQGYFHAYRHMVEEDVDLILHLGDYIYESSWGVDHVRSHGAPEPITLEDYRARYELYKSDPDLQQAHAAAPWLVTWDDHEVDNDYANDRSENLDPESWFLKRRAAAYKAYYEHMPLRRGAVPLGAEMRLFTSVDFGRLASFHILDDRQYRTHQVCAPRGEGGSTMIGGSDECPDRFDPSQSLLGSHQEAWLDNRLQNSSTSWNVLSQQTLIARQDRHEGEGHLFWTDGWDGYPLARKKLLTALETHRVSNPMAIGGDVHAHWVADLKRDFEDERSKIVGTEFVGTSITSQTALTPARAESIMRENPHIRHGDGERRGFVTVEMTPSKSTVRLRSLANVQHKDAAIETARTYVVEDGVPGAQEG